MSRYRYSMPTLEEAQQLAEAQARLREHNAQLRREHMARKRAEREALRDARRQVKEQRKAAARQKREAQARLVACVREQEQAELEEIKRQKRALREADRQLRGGKGVSMRFTPEQCTQLEELAARYSLSQSEIIRRLVSGAHHNMKGQDNV